MKKSILSVVILSVAISACTTQKLTSSLDNDDVYASSSSPAKATQYRTQASYSGEQVITAPDSATWAKSSSSTFADDYNDYSYSSRISRFSNSDTTKGYFDESHSDGTNDVTTESTNPDVNIYFGVGAGYGGYYGPSYSYGFGWGYPYYGWGFDWGWGWGYPYYSWYNPWYYPYGCCCCYNPWYYEGYYPYYPTNTFYGPRNNLTAYDGISGIRNDRSSSQNIAGPIDLNQRVSTPPVNSRITDPALQTRSTEQMTNRSTGQTALRETGQTAARSTNQTATRSVPANQQEYRYSRSGSTNQAPYPKSDNKKQVQTRSQQTAPRYIRPGSENVTKRAGSTQSYSSPVYRQPKSSQEYISPRTNNAGAARTTPSTIGQKTNTTPPTTGNKSRTVPTNNNKRSYTTPSGSYSPSSTTPVRSGSNYSAPARSGSSGSYSAPSRSGSSGGSYSAPSRSGSSGGSSGGSGGRRR